MQSLSSRLIVGFVLYGALALLAILTLADWRFRSAVLILLAGLAVKSWIAERMRG